MSQVFFAQRNKQALSKIIYDVVKRDFHISLKPDFARVMEQIMNSVSNQYQRPPHMTEDEHLNRLNKISISECIKHVKGSLEQPQNIQGYNNMSNGSPYDAAFGGLIQHPGGQIPPPNFQGQGGFPPQGQGQGFPPQGQGFPPQGQGFPPQGQGFPPQGQGFPPQGQGFPPQGQGFPPQGQGFSYPQQSQGYPGVPSQQLPFQQVNTRTENGVTQDPEVALAQRLADRNSLDIASGGRPQMGSTQLPNFNLMHISSQQDQINRFLQQQGNVHPSQVQQFIAMTPQQQHHFRMSNPDLYHQILATIHRMNNPQQGPKQHKRDKRDKKHKKQQDRRQQDSDTESSSGSETSSVSSSLSEGMSPSSPAPSAQSGSDPYYSGNVAPPAHHGGAPQHWATHRSDKPYRPMGQSEYLSLDFRENLQDIMSDKYVLTFNQISNVEQLELESCIINQTANLEAEPYIYMVIDEVPGDHIVSGSKTRERRAVFGKLYLERTVNGFLHYRPEHCVKQFINHQLGSFKQFTISFLKYDQHRLPLNRLNVKGLSKSKTKIKLVTNTPHHTAVGDKISIYMSTPDELFVSNVDVLSVRDSTTIDCSVPGFELTKHPDLSFEKVGVKCTMTFKVHRR